MCSYSIQNTELLSFTLILMLKQADLISVTRSDSSICNNLPSFIISSQALFKKPDLNGVFQCSCIMCLLRCIFSSFLKPTASFCIWMKCSSSLFTVIVKLLQLFLHLRLHLPQHNTVDKAKKETNRNNFMPSSEDCSCYLFLEKKKSEISFCLFAVILLDLYTVGARVCHGAWGLLASKDNFSFSIINFT